jgi:hypothetical protein
MILAYSLSLRSLRVAEHLRGQDVAVFNLILDHTRDHTSTSQFTSITSALSRVGFVVFNGWNPYFPTLLVVRSTMHNITIYRTIV